MQADLDINTSVVEEAVKLDWTSRRENNQLIFPGANKQGYPIHVRMISQCVDTNATGSSSQKRQLQCWLLNITNSHGGVAL